jgi:hypothetical protein
MTASCLVKVIKEQKNANILQKKFNEKIVKVEQGLPRPLLQVGLHNKTAKPTLMHFEPKINAKTSYKFF